MNRLKGRLCNRYEENLGSKIHISEIVEINSHYYGVSVRGLL